MNNSWIQPDWPPVLDVSEINEEIFPELWTPELMEIVDECVPKGYCWN